MSLTHLHITTLHSENSMVPCVLTLLAVLPYKGLTLNHNYHLFHSKQTTYW